MPLTISNFVGGATIVASELLDKQNQVEEFINGGIEATDLRTSPAWVDSKLIVKPEFYGSPAPRTHGTTFDCHHRRTTNALTETALFYEDITTDEYLSIPGLGASFHLPQEAHCQIYATFYVFGTQGGSYPSDLEHWVACNFRLFVNEDGKSSTTRSHYASASGSEFQSRKQHSIAHAVNGTLARGNHSVSVRIKMNKNSATATRNWEKIYVGARNLVVHLSYK